MSLLTSEGLLADHAQTSNDCYMNENNRATKMNVNHQAVKTNQAEKSDSESTDGEEITRTDEREAIRENRHRKRKRDQPDELELKSLKKHPERKTCPKSLQYQARARIRADDDFERH